MRLFRFMACFRCPLIELFPLNRQLRVTPRPRNWFDIVLVILGLLEITPGAESSHAVAEIGS